MAVDNIGTTVSVGDQCLLAGVVREIDGDTLVVVTADGRHAFRVKSTDTRKIDTVLDPVELDEVATTANNSQPLNANLTALANLVGAANKLGYFTGSGTMALADLTAAARTLLAATDAAGQRSALGLAALAVLATVGASQIDNDAVTDGKLRNSAALSVIGRAANSSGDPADIAASSDGQVLRRSGSALGFGQVATAGVADDAITYAKLQNVSATDVVLGRQTAGAGNAEEIPCKAAARSFLALEPADGDAVRFDSGAFNLLENPGEPSPGSIWVRSHNGSRELWVEIPEP